MTRRTSSSQLYRRGCRYWADFRAFGDVGGGQQPLVAPGTRLATTDYSIAVKLHAQRLTELEGARKDLLLHGLRRRVGLAEFSRDFLIQRQRAGRVTEQWLAASQVWLERACNYFGTERPLHTISPEDVQGWMHSLRGTPNGRGGTLSATSIRHHLFALSLGYRYAQAGGLVPSGFNPVASLVEKPLVKRRESRWLEPHMVALVLESARTLPPPANGRPAVGGGCKCPGIGG